MALLLTGCALTPTKDFVQGSVRMTPPIQQETEVQFAIIGDGGTAPGRFTDAKGRAFDYYIDHRIHTKTPGAIYLNACPGEPKSIRVKNEAEFRQKLGF